MTPVADDLAGLGRKVAKVRRELTDQSLMRSVGMEGKKIGNAAISADAGGNLALTNWRRGKPVNLGVRFDNLSEATLQIAPSPRGRGPVRVLTDGRKAGRSRRGRPVSASRGKGTWDKASAQMEQELPKVARTHTTKVLRKHFG